MTRSIHAALTMKTRTKTVAAASTDSFPVSAHFLNTSAVISAALVGTAMLLLQARFHHHHHQLKLARTMLWTTRASTLRLPMPCKMTARKAFAVPLRQVAQDRLRSAAAMPMVRVRTRVVATGLRDSLRTKCRKCKGRTRRNAQASGAAVWRMKLNANTSRTAQKCRR